MSIPTGRVRVLAALGMLQIAVLYAGLTRLFMSTMDWYGVPVKILMWPVRHLMYSHVALTAGTEVTWRALHWHLFFSTVKMILLLAILNAFSRGRIARFLASPRCAFWIACGPPYFMTVLLLLFRTQIEHRVKDTTPLLLVLGVAMIIGLKYIARARLSAVSRSLCSLPIWLFWAEWLQITTSERIFSLTGFIGFALYSVAISASAVHQSETTIRPA